MVNVTGMRTTENVLAARKVVDMAEQIALLDPNDAPFVTLLKQMKGGKREVFNPRFDWLEDDLLASTSTVSTAISSASTTSLVVADGTIFRVNDVINIPSVGENMLVTAVSGNTLTVTRGYGTTAAAASIAVSAAVEIIGNAQEEGATLREVKSRNEENCFNLTQIFRTPISLTGTEEQMKMYGGKDRAYQRRKALLEHKRDIAKSLYFGQRKQSGTRRTMGGLAEFIGADNTTTFSSGSNALTYANFNKVAEKAFAHGGSEKVMLAGPKMMAAIDSWAIDGIMTKPEKTATYGIHVKQLITSFGILDVVYDSLLAGSYADRAFIIDPENVRYAYMKGRDTKLLTDRQANDADAVIDEYMTECGLEVKLPSTHHMIVGAY